MSFILPPLQVAVPIVGADGRPSLGFVQGYNNTLSAISNAVSNIADVIKTVTGQDIAVGKAQTAASQAQQTAENAAAAASSLAGKVALALSYPVPSNSLSASADAATATVSIAATTRRYLDGSAVSVAAGSLSGLALSTQYWIYYSDPDLAGGAVTYHASTVATDAAQIAGVHCVGKIITPAANLTSTGQGSAGPGVPL